MRTAWPARDGLRYGLMGLPLAFVALPLYVLLPNHYARAYGIPLGTLGALLLWARLLDALVDPWLGRLSDRLFAHSLAQVLRVGSVAALCLAAGFTALFFPPLRGQGLLVWAMGALCITYLAYSLLSITHQSWGARLGGDALQRSSIVAWREGLALLGVLLASVLAVLVGLGITTVVLVAALVVGLLAWQQAPRPVASPPGTQLARERSAYAALARRGFAALLGVFMLNGIASAIPATLVLFFIQDRLQAPQAMEGLFLVAYFLSAALSMPLWLRAIARWGLWRAWLGGMLLAVAVFAWATLLGAGDLLAFGAVCALSGLALGGDLAVAPALLTGVIQSNGDQGAHEGSYFGWWNFATKLNLALAAGLALPALQALGYSPGVRTPEALQALVLAYCVLPCALKLIAAYALYKSTKTYKYT